MANTPTPMNQRSYPTFDQSVPRQIVEAFRKLWDKVYLLLSDLGPTAASASGSNTAFVVTTELNVVPGCQVVLPRTGWWVIIGTFDITILDAALRLDLALSVANTTQKKRGHLKGALNERATVTQVWHVQANKGDVAKLQVQGEAGVANSTVDTASSAIVALYAGQQ